MPTSTGTSARDRSSARPGRSRAPTSSPSPAPGAPWIDLHWIFQVGVSWLYEHGGVVALNLAKCAVTCLAVLLLVTARRRDWPLWVMLLAWLPALLVLGGRIYVRPETLSLLYLSIFLAVVFRWDRHPALVAILPFVQVAWVNSQGLFVLGPIILVFAPRRPGRHAHRVRPTGRPGPGTVAMVADRRHRQPGDVRGVPVQSLRDRGALFPIELAGTMRNPIFSQTIGELTPIPVFIRRAGLGNLPLQLHLAHDGPGRVEFPGPARCG